MNNKYEKFKNVLEEHHNFPCSYTFKFIVKKEKLKEFKDVLDEIDIKEKVSKNGNFKSITLKKKMKNSQEIIEIYEKVGNVDGVMTL